jgi:hypothetical protein
MKHQQQELALQLPLVLDPHPSLNSYRAAAAAAAAAATTSQQRQQYAS